MMFCVAARNVENGVRMWCWWSATEHVERAMVKEILQAAWWYANSTYDLYVRPL